MVSQRHHLRLLLREHWASEGSNEAGEKKGKTSLLITAVPSLREAAAHPRPVQGRNDSEARDKPILGVSGANASWKVGQKRRLDVEFPVMELNLVEQPLSSHKCIPPYSGRTSFSHNGSINSDAFQLHPRPVVFFKSLKVKWLTLCDLMDCSLPGSSVHGILQARVLEWGAISFSGVSSQPRDKIFLTFER